MADASPSVSAARPMRQWSSQYARSPRGGIGLRNPRRLRAAQCSACTVHINGEATRS
jgi:hypothetical protein